MEKALARSEKELAVFHQLQEDASRSFPVAVNKGGRHRDTGQLARLDSPLNSDSPA